MKLATALLAPLVAIILFWPAPAAAALMTQAAPADDPQPLVALEAVPGITEVHATPSRLRGRVDVEWTYTGAPFAGQFVVERSTNGSFWRSIRTCAAPFDADKERYSCADTRLTSGTTYAYRVCISVKGASCTSAGATKPVTVKAP